MAKITSKSQLNVGTEILIDEPNRTITLAAAGNLVAKDGVSLQAVYSKLVDLWTVATYQDSPFPMYAIDALSGQFQIGTDGATYSGWKWANDTTRNMLRDGGWSEFDATGAMTRQYAGFVGLGSINTGAQPYYQITPTGAATNFPFVDQFNVGVQVFGNTANGNFDSRTFAKAFVREQGKKYKSSILADTGKTSTGAFLVNFLIANEDDLKIAVADSALSAAPYDGITVAYYSANQNRSIGGTAYPFRVIIQGNGGTLEQIYAKVQYLLRQSTSINVGGTAGNVIGKTADELLSFVGDTLITARGVYIDGVLAADSNRVEFYDQNGVRRINPYTASGAITFNSPLVGSGSSYRLMYTSPPGAGNDYGESGAITVNDASGQPIAGAISAATLPFTYDFDGNTQGGFTAGTDRPVTLIGIRPGSGKFVAATGTLTRAKNISLSLVAEVDRVYS